MRTYEVELTDGTGVFVVADDTDHLHETVSAANLTIQDYKRVTDTQRVTEYGIYQKRG